MNIKKQALTLLVVIGVIGLIQAASFYFKKPGPEQLTLDFITHSTKPEQVVEYVTEADAKIVKLLGLNYLELIKNQLPPGNTEITVASSLALSETQQKVDLAVSDKVISFSLVKEGSNWKINFDLPKKHKIQQLIKEIKELETLNSEPEALLRAYNELQEVSPSEDYEEKIKSLKSLIAEQEAFELYKQKVEFSQIKLKNKFLSGKIQNKGDRSLSKVTATLLFANNKGEVINTQEVVVFEVIPGSFVFGKPIKPNFEKKFGLNLENLSLPKDTILNLEVKSLEFYK